jgi:FkbM family methyltransferase
MTEPMTGVSAKDLQDTLQVVQDVALQSAMLINQILDLNAAMAKDNPDQLFGGRTWAQHGDDMAILNIFQLLGNPKPSYIDIGAHHPTRISNTALLYSRGSRGINIEANPNLIFAFQQQRPDDINLNIGIGDEAGTLPFYVIDGNSGRSSFDRRVAEDFVRECPSCKLTDVIPVPVMTLEQVLRQYWNGQFPNLMSIDTEGLDEKILRSYDFSQGPRPDVICVEIVLLGDDTYGQRIKAHLEACGYFLYVRCWGNGIFVLEKHRDALY